LRRKFLKSLTAEYAEIAERDLAGAFQVQKRIGAFKIVLCGLGG